MLLDGDRHVIEAGRDGHDALLGKVSNRLAFTGSRGETTLLAMVDHGRRQSLHAHRSRHPASSRVGSFAARGDLVPLG